MSTGFTTQGLQDLLAFPFRVPGGKVKLLIAAALGLAGFIVPILPGLFLVGYGGLIMRRIIREHGEPYLPEWDNWSEMFMLGLRITGATFIYSLPVLLLVGAGYLGMMAPMFLLPLGGAPSRQNFLPFFGIQLAGMFGGMAVMGIGFIVALGFFLVLLPVIGHVVATDSFSAAFRVSEWWKILRANFGGFVVALVVTAGVYAALVLIAQGLYMTMVFCLLIPLLMTLVGAYIMVIGDVLIAHAYAEGATKVGARLENQPIPPEPSRA